MHSERGAGNHENFKKGWQVNKFTFLKDYFIAKITSQEWTPGTKIPPERELANMFGVTVNTISKVITSLEAEGYLKRVHGRGTFVVEKPGKHYSFHIVLPEFSYGISPLILAGIVNEASSRGVSMKIFVHHNRADEALRITHSIIEGNPPEGVVMIPPQFGTNRDRKRVVSILLRRGIKVVLLDREVDGLELDSVVLDNIEGVRSLMEHVFYHGARNIIFVSERPSKTTIERENAYKSIMEEKGLTPVVKRLSHPIIRSSYRFFRELTVMNRLPEAVLGINDLLAFGAEYALLESGVKIGKDLLLLGFDDLPFSEQLPVPLTTYRQPFFEMGRKSVELLIKRIENPMDPVEKVVLKGSLIVRQSCGCNFS